jgi:hypothetical protein
MRHPREPGENTRGYPGVNGLKIHKNYQLSRPFWDSPNPSPAGECAPPPFGSGGRGHTRWRERGWESPNSNEGTYTVVLFIFTLCFEDMFNCSSTWISRAAVAVDGRKAGRREKAGGQQQLCEKRCQRHQYCFLFNKYS